MYYKTEKKKTLKRHMNSAHAFTQFSSIQDSDKDFN